MKKQAFFVVLLLFLFGSLRSSEIKFDSNTTKLDLSNKVVTDKLLKSIAETCPNLEALSLNSAKEFTYVGLQDILDSCKKLKHLSLWACKIEFERITVIELKKLEYLSLSYSAITDSGLQKIVKNSLNLNFLDLDSTEISGEGVDWDKLSNLTNLSLCETTITDKGLENISGACKMLVMFELRDTKITHSGLQKILDTCVSLERLNLSWCKNIDFEKLNWSKLNKLETLRPSYTDIAETGLRKILLYCPHLSYLSLAGCTNLRKEWQRIFDGEKEIQKLREQFSPFPDLARAFATVL